MCAADRQDRDTAAVRIVEPINQVEITRPTASGAHGQASRQVRLGPGGKGSRLFVSHGDPSDLATFADGIRDAIQGVAGNAVHSLHPGDSQRRNQ